MISSDEITFNVYRLDLRGKTFEEVDEITQDPQMFIELASWVKVLGQNEQYLMNITYYYCVVTNSTQYVQQIIKPQFGRNVLYLQLLTEPKDWNVDFECADDLTQQLTNTTYQNWYGIFSAFDDETEIKTYTTFLGSKFNLILFQ